MIEHVSVGLDSAEEVSCSTSRKEKKIAAKKLIRDLRIEADAQRVNQRNEMVYQQSLGRLKSFISSAGLSLQFL